MGIDAFNLLPYLKPTYRQIGPILHGKTGSLYRDPFNRIHRQLAWAEIDNGVARIIGYAPRLNDSLLSPAGARTLEGRAVPYKSRPLYSPANR
jgi:hypothetical protein